MKKINRYKAYFSGLIFTAYLFFFILNIFHYHKINLSTEFQVRSEKESQGNKIDLFYFDLNIICKFQNTFSSIQTAVHFNDFIPLSYKNIQRLSFDSKFCATYLNNFPENSPLRAPPSGKYFA
ncbi:MAG: hypothetical protein ACM34M_15770 [Ignavibacteria bacterium]